MQIEALSIDPLAKRICDVFQYTPHTKRRGIEMPIVELQRARRDSPLIEAIRDIAYKACNASGLVFGDLAIMRNEPKAVIARRAIVYVARHTVSGARYMDIGPAIGISENAPPHIYRAAFDAPYAQKVRALIGVLAPELRVDTGVNLPQVIKA